MGREVSLAVSMFDDIYFWTKNGRPDTEKDHYRNSSCQHIIRKMKKDGIIMKTYHMDPSEKLDTDFLQNDLTPFVKYSLNKKKRWETEGNLRTLTNLQSSNRDMDVIVNDRVWYKSSPYFCFRCHMNEEYVFQFPLRSTCQLDTDDNYRCFTSGSVFGQPLKSLLPENRSSEKETDDVQLNDFETPKVVYHILTAPRNYEKLPLPDIHPIINDPYLNHPSATYWKRWKVRRDAFLDFHYDALDVSDEPDDKIDNDLRKDFGTGPRKYYNLMEHLVDGRCCRQKKKKPE